MSDFGLALNRSRERLRLQQERLKLEPGLVILDFSHGQENFPVKVFNTTGNGELPNPLFEYRHQNVISDKCLERLRWHMETLFGSPEMVSV